MAISADRKTEYDLKQKLAGFLQSRGELILSELKTPPIGLVNGTVSFEKDPSGTVQKFYLEENNKWFEVFLFGPIPNHRRELIANYFGFDPKNNQPLQVSEKLGPFYRKRNYFVTNQQKGGV